MLTMEVKSSLINAKIADTPDATSHNDPSIHPIPNPEETGQFHQKANSHYKIPKPHPATSPNETKSFQKLRLG